MSFLSSHVRDAPAVFALSLLNRRILNIPKSPALLFFFFFSSSTVNPMLSPRDRRRSLRLALLNAYQAQAQAYLVCESAARGQATLQQWQRALALWQEAQAWIVRLRRRQLAGL
ncbi:hypothetical protein Focb16_v007529 [Fusarium oxysporum f. sp. cubense]|uniref:Uncharacterized protein n=1 Tax=Fusarium oxysporum f. sp. cubense TaxID=61366 RepID=A0A559LQV5_FUSOC|nr:hypothetical protein Focb16_v007529 [Fusarium oxysporum f. sp. cubense]